MQVRTPLNQQQKQQKQQQQQQQQQQQLQQGQHLLMKLALTPELRQSLHILRMSATELDSYLQEQVLDNPMLEYMPTYAASSDFYSPVDSTLEQWLIDQLHLIPLSPAVRRTADYIAGNLDDNGYLPLSLEEIGSAARQPLAVVAAALEVVQSLEPAGVGARSAKECLLLQIRRDRDAAAGAYEAVNEHLHTIAQGKLKELGDRLGFPIEQTQAIIEYIRSTLNPRPGLAIGNVSKSEYIVPDAYIRLSEAGIEVEIHRQAIIRLTVSTQLDAAGQTSDDDVSLYIQERTRAARAVMLGLEQRVTTLTRVVVALAEEQAAFLEHGPIALKPLQLKQLALKLNLHTSTISRAIRQKYAQTPYGLFALKQFLSGGVPTFNTEVAVSSSQAMERIRSWIAAENKKKPYSDRQLAELLAQEGIRLSRRTVMKYREALRILASPYRRVR